VYLRKWHVLLIFVFKTFDVFFFSSWNESNWYGIDLHPCFLCARRIGDVEARRVVRDRREFNAPYTLIATVVSNVYFMSDIHTELQQQSLWVLIPLVPHHSAFFYSYDHGISFFFFFFKCCGRNHNHQVSTTTTCVSFFSLSRLSRLRAIINNGGKKWNTIFVFIK
jgi:hypothetical protein